MKNKRGYYDVFVKTCARFPSAVAMRAYVGDMYRLYTYSELYGACEYIAQNLQQLQQVQCARGCIGLLTTRNILVPCVIAAAHKCCKSFIFIDPLQDIEAIINSMKLPVVISINNENEEDCLEDERKADKHISIFGYSVNFFQYRHSHNEISNKFSQDHSFIALTSGSTGEPKRIQVPLQCIQPNIDDFTKLFNITPQDIIYFSTPLTFDPSMVEILLACKNGASLLIAPEKIDVLFPNDGKNSITVWQTTPSKFFQHSNANIKNKILCANSSLKILALGGEPLNGVKRLRELKNSQNKTKIFVLYGVTEMSCWACAAELNLARCSADSEVPLGQCLSKTQVLVQPTSTSSQSQTSSGKILLVSKTRKCVIISKSSGSELNSLKFVDTGDHAEVRNGTIYYKGRMDDVIKRFGHKINLQFIEQTIMQCPRVKTCSCVWMPKPRLLVVYFSSETLSSQHLSDFLKCKLDDKHWPDHIVRVDNLPTNAHGKISRLILSRLFESKKPSERPLTLESMTSTFVEQLNTVLSCHFCFKDIKDKDFFSIGGTSFLAVTLSNKLNAIHQQFGKLVLPSLLTRKHTIGEVMHIAEKEICTNVTQKTKKRLKRCASITESSETSAKKSSTQRSYSEPIEFVTIWTYDTGKCVDASPTLFETGTYLYVVVGSHSGRIVIFDAIAGLMVGVIKLTSRVEASAFCYHGGAGGPGEEPCGAVGAHDGTVVAFSLQTARERWRTNVGAMVKSKATSCNGLLFVATYDGVIQYLDIMTGEIKNTVRVSEQAISADLVLAKNEYVVAGALCGACGACGVRAAGAGAGGALAWRAAAAGPVFAAPVLYDADKYVIFAEVGGEIHCRTVEKGIKIWKYQGAKGNIFSSMYVREVDKLKWQVIFGCHDKRVYSIIIKNFQPSLQWKTLLDSPVYSTPCGLNNKLVLAVSKNGNLYVLEAENGILLGEHKLPGETFSSPAVFSDYIYIGCRNDLLYGLRCVLNM